MWNNETGVCINEKKGKKLNKDKDDWKSLILCDSKHWICDCCGQKPLEYYNQ